MFIAVVEVAAPEHVVVEEYQLRVMADAEHEICALVKPDATQVSAFWLTPKYVVLNKLEHAESV